MKKIRVTIELSDENFEVLKSEDAGNFEDPCELLWQLKESVTAGDFELVPEKTEG